MKFQEIDNDRKNLLSCIHTVSHQDMCVIMIEAE